MGERFNSGLLKQEQVLIPVLLLYRGSVPVYICACVTLKGGSVCLTGVCGTAEAGEQGFQLEKSPLSSLSNGL